MILYNYVEICCTQGMKDDVCVATTVRAMIPLAAQSAIRQCGEYTHRTAGPASLVLTHSAISNARVMLYNYVVCRRNMLYARHER